MKIEIVLLLSIFLISLASGILISEIEPNPAGTDAGSEWVELYCDEEVNFDSDDWGLDNGDGGRLGLEGKCEGYLILEFDEQWLDNKDEFVSLYKNGKRLDITRIFNDGGNDDRTWQICHEWKFTESTKGRKNGCEEVGSLTVEELKERFDNEEVEELDGVESSEKKDVEKIPVAESDLEDLSFEKGVINLNPVEEVDEASEGEEVVYESKNQKIKKYVVYGFAIFLILVIVFLLVRD